MKRQIGFIRWYDELSDDGILESLDGQEYYFNSWSFNGTKYQVTGKCKKTGKIKTIKTRSFPGLFLSHKALKDKRCKSIKHKTPVIFEQAEGISQRWAVKINISNKHKNLIQEHLLISCLEWNIFLDEAKEERYKLRKPYALQELDRKIAETLEA